MATRNGRSSSAAPTAPRKRSAQSPDYRHHPDPAGVKPADGAGRNRGTDWIVDVACKHCGRSGSVRIDPEDVEF